MTVLSRPYANSVLLEGRVSDLEYEHEDSEEGTLIWAWLHLEYPRVPIDVTDLMLAEPMLDPILMSEVQIVGTLTDDGEYPYIKATSLKELTE